MALKSEFAIDGNFCQVQIVTDIFSINGNMFGIEGSAFIVLSVGVSTDGNTI